VGSNLIKDVKIYIHTYFHLKSERLSLIGQFGLVAIFSHSDKRPTNQLHVAYIVVIENLTATQLVRKLPTFYGTQRLYTITQDPATGPYPDADASSPHLPTLFP